MRTHAVQKQQAGARPGLERLTSAFASHETARHHAAGNLATRRLLATRDVDAPHPIEYPHADRIGRALGTSTPLRAVVDPRACDQRHVPAFTVGDVTHFAGSAPDVHVAAHEAAHQLQHTAVTNDGWLGAEGHAAVVADMVRSNRNARPWIGRAGRPVAAATRNYVETKEYGGWARLGETGDTLTYSGHEAFATPSLIAQAATILKNRRSGVALSAGPTGPTVKAPNGSGMKTLSRVQVAMEADPSGATFYSDCRQAAKEVMGPKHVDTAVPPDAAAINVDGRAQAIAMPEIITDAAALVFFVDKRIAETPGYAALSDEEKQKLIAKWRSDFDWLDKDEKVALKKTMVSDARAKALGIDRYAAPQVGEAFAVVPAENAGIGSFRFHFATVIMSAGPDVVTFENSGGARDEKTAGWKMETYGPAAKAQTFYDEWKVFGDARHVVRVGNQAAPPPPYDVRSTPTRELVARYQASTNAGERYYLKQELDTRSVFLLVEVLKQQDSTFGDDVRVMFDAAFGRLSTGTVSIYKGQSYAFTMPVVRLMPLRDPLMIDVYEADVFTDDLIGTIAWRSPYIPIGHRDLVGAGAHYAVTLTF